MSPGRAACVAVGFLLLLSGCGDGAAGLPGPVDHAAALRSSALPTAASTGSAAATTDSALAPAGPVAAPGGSGPSPHAAPAVVAGPAGTGPTPAGAPSSRAATGSRAANEPRPGTTNAPHVVAPGPPAGQPPPPVAPPPAPPPTRTITEPTRTPAPLLIDPVDAYGGPLGQFTQIVEGRSVPGRCGDGGRPTCLRVVPHQVGDPSLPLTRGCAVKASRPDLQPDPDDREKKLTLPGDELPLTVDTDVDCAENLEPDAT